MRRFTPSILLVYLIYLVALATTTALFFFWIMVVQRYNVEINQTISRLGFEWNHFHWFVHTFGAGFFFLVIVALTVLLAVTLSERRYSRKREELLSGMTHELKTPVAAIRLHAQTLQQDDLRKEERELFLGYILQEAQRVGQLVDNLLESSRLLAAGESEPSLEPIDLSAFFLDYQDSVQRRFDLRRVDLRFEVKSRAVVMATSEALQRIMDNLIDNALRFTQAGGEISCEVRDLHGNAEIVVTDTGVGIPKGELGRIFDRFYRLRREVDGARRGTGLGLSIVQRLVQEMRGKIEAFSGEGSADSQGARFEIRLPRIDPKKTEQS